MRLYIILFTFFITFNFIDANEVLIDKEDFSDDISLHDAVRNSNIELIKFLIDRGSDINKKGLYGYTPLHISVGMNNIEITKLLIENGADVNIKDDKGEIPLIKALRSKEVTISKLLICSGSKRDIEDINNIATMNYLVKNDDYRLINMSFNENIEKYCSKEIGITFDKKTLKKDTKLCGDLIGSDFINARLFIVDDKKAILLAPEKIEIYNDNRRWCTESLDLAELDIGEYTLIIKGSTDKKHVQNHLKFIN